MNLNKNAISPLIASILIIVVVVAVIGVILLWGKNFTNESLTSASSFSQDKTVSDFVWQDDITGKNLFIKNTHTSLSKTIIGYKISSSLDYAYLNKYHYLDESFLLSKNSIAQLTLGCVPEKNFSIELLTDSNEYISFPVTSKFFDPSECTFSFSITSPLENSINALNSSISFTSEILNSSGTPSCTWISSIDGTFSTSCNTTYSSLSSGSHDINLVVEDSGDILTQSTSIIVKDSLSVSINSPNNSSGSITGVEVSFSSIVDNNYGVYNCLWDSNIDNILSSSCNFSKLDLSAGTHLITLSITDSLETVTTSITIKVYSLLVASISSPSNGSSFSTGIPVSFSSNISGGDGSYSCSWSDNSNSLSSLCSFSRTYLGPSWSTGANLLNTYRHNLGIATVGTNIYAIGGHSTSPAMGYKTNIVEMYNSLTNSWVTKTSMPTPREYLSCSAVDSKIYCIGGRASSYTGIVEIYDTVSNTWTTGTSMPTTRGSLSCSTVGTKIYCAGGYDGTSRLNTLEIYNTVSNTWSTGTNMLTGRMGLISASVGSDVYFIGGTHDGSTPSQKVEVYNTLTNAWSTKANMPTGGWYLSCVAVNSKIYCFGGTNFSPPRDSILEIYATGSNSWTTGAPLPRSRNNLACSNIGLNIYCAFTHNINILDIYNVGELGSHNIVLNVSDNYGQTTSANSTITVN